MFCRHCGQEVSPNAEICLKCGSRPLNGSGYCQACGAPTGASQEVCLKCGVRLRGGEAEGRDWLVTLLLCFFLGGFGVHRFYTGHTTIGIIQLLTLGACGIWTVIDFVLILTGKYRDAEGRPLVKR